MAPVGNVSLRKPGNLQPADIQPWVQALVQQRAENFGVDNPRYKCLPDGPNYSVGQGFKRILQTEDADRDARRQASQFQIVSVAETLLWSIPNANRGVSRNSPCTGGWAAGARDVLVTAGHTPVMITYNDPSPDPAYANMRAYMWMKGPEWVKNGGSLPHVPELIGELMIPQYTYLNGKFEIEPKEFIKDRLGRSPNYADALFNTFAMF